MWVSVTRTYRVIPANSVGLRLVAAKLQARKLKQQCNENVDVDVVSCKESTDEDVPTVKKEDVSDETDLDKQENHASENLKVELDDAAADFKKGEPQADSAERIINAAAETDVLRTETTDENMEEDAVETKTATTAATVDESLVKSEVPAVDATDSTRSDAKFGDDFSISEALISRSAYPRVTKPYSRLDHLLDRRTAQWQTELKQKTLCEQLIARYRTQEAERKRSASVPSETSQPKFSPSADSVMPPVQSISHPTAVFSSSIDILPAARTVHVCYSSVCRADANHAALSCYSTVCRLRDKATCDASSVTLSNGDLCDSGVEDNDDIDKVTDDLSKDVTEVDSTEVKSSSGSDVNGDHEMDLVNAKDAKDAISSDANGISRVNSTSTNDTNTDIKCVDKKLSATVTESSTLGADLSKTTSATKPSVVTRPVSPTLSLQKYTQDGRIHLTAALVEEFEAKLAIFGSTRYQVSLAKRAGPGRPPSKSTASGVQKGSVTQKKLPSVQRFRGRRGGRRSLFALERHVLVSLARREGKRECPGFNYGCKMNNVGWPYPCPRPFFRTAWRYRTQTVRNISGVALQLRILWACIRWDELNARVPAAGSNTVTTETDITTTELLKRRDVPPHGLRSEYLVRKIVVPISVPTHHRGE
jgi:hypothetical protein